MIQRAAAGYGRHPIPWDGDDGGGDGGGGGGGSGGGGDNPDLEAQARRAVEQGRAIEKITSLLRDNYELREDRRQLRDRLDAVPNEALEQAEGADSVVVLTDDEAEAWQELSEVGGPGEIRERLERGAEAEAELSDRRRRERIRQAADAHGLNAGPLERLVEQDDLEVELEERERDGEEVHVALVRAPSENGDEPEAVELTAYAEENWAEFAPALTGEGGGGSGGGEEDEGGGGTRFPGSPSELDRESGGEPDLDEIRDEKKSQGRYRSGL